ncbi:MAG: DUF6989 domain-containing protein [Myxococcota bacterium]
MTTAPPDAAALPASADDALEDARARTINASVALSTGFYAANAWFAWGWTGATGLSVVLLALFGVHVLRTGDAFVRKLLVAGVFYGLFVLLSDAVCVAWGGLVYTPAGPFAYKSPLYMPLSAISAVVQMGNMAYVLDRSRGLVASALITGLVGAIYMPFYEYVAKAGELWIYQDVPMILDTVPYYIILCEFLICLAMPAAIRQIARRETVWAVPFGTLLGGVVLGSTALSCWLLA